MENQTSTSATGSAPNQDGAAQAAAAGFGDRIRERARVVKSQLDAAEARAKQRWADSKARQRLDAAEARAKQRWADSKARQRLAGSKPSQRLQEMPVKLRTALHQAVDKVRGGLDLPSRREVSELAHRIDELDRKLGDYELQAIARKKRKGDQNGD